MVFKTIVRELKEITDVIGSKSKKSFERKPWSGRTKSYMAPDEELLPCVESIEQGQWANLPPELLLDIIRRVEESETSWPARAVVMFCASVCKSWREITKEIVTTPEQCGKITFPISLKQPGSRESPIQCFIRRDRTTSTYYLYFGLAPSEAEKDKLLLAARKIRKRARTDFVISLVSDNFSRASNTYIGRLRSNLLGTKFTVFDRQPPCEAAMQTTSRTNCRIKTKQVSPTVSACNYTVGSISYELNVLRTRGPRRINCVMHSIPISSIEEGGTAPTPTSFSQSFDERVSTSPCSKIKESFTHISSLGSPAVVQQSVEPLILKNKAPRWHEQVHCWCLNFKGRVTMASVKNFQLVAAVEPSHNVPPEEQEKVILQFGKIGKDIFTMDYHYPLSAFQAFAICVSSFDTKPTCE